MKKLGTLKGTKRGLTVKKRTALLDSWSAFALVMGSDAFIKARSAISALHALVVAQRSTDHGT